YNTDGTVDSSYKQTGYLINAASNAVGTSYDDDVNIGTQDNFNGTINLNAQSKKFDHQGSLDVLQGQLANQGYISD
ncbi:hypothetical protein WP50_02520, partial [Lactiplantibacillus plantarum]